MPLGDGALFAPLLSVRPAFQTQLTRDSKFKWVLKGVGLPLSPGS